MIGFAATSPDGVVPLVGNQVSDPTTQEWGKWAIRVLYFRISILCRYAGKVVFSMSCRSSATIFLLYVVPSMLSS